MATFGERLKFLREKEGLLQKELAAKIDVAISTLASWESGYRIPELGKAEALADYFRCSVDYLLGRTDIYQIQTGPLAAHHDGPKGEDLSDLEDIIADAVKKAAKWREEKQKK